MKKTERTTFGIKLTGLVINAFIIYSLVSALTSGFKVTH
ncbi:hypothetical protein JOC48_002087 [Aquibacillus albus]|uniref:Uncharacterized protein n=1 Tax=Aquibacillus albus TaxID=1168171 RepID=A0ABS2N0A4_9BACI|nr:hypothetical protein [Aquibacillus albus]